MQQSPASSVRLPRRPVRTRTVCAATLLAGLAIPPGPHAARAAAAGTVDLIAPLDASQTRLRFHEGLVGPDGALAIDPTLPAMAGAASAYVLTQWNHAVYATPADLQIGSNRYGPFDSILAPDLETGVVVHRLAQGGPPMFTLVDRDGTLSAGGGRATYLSTQALPNVPDTFDREIDLSYAARVSLAAIVTNTPTASSSGAVMAQAYAGIGLLFVDPAGHDAAQFIFMQVGLTVSNADPIGQGGLICAGGTPVLYAPPVPNAMLLPFATDAGPMHPIRADLSAAVAAMLANPTPCGGVSAWDAAKRNLANWHMTGLYIGAETENTDTRPGALTSFPQGHVWITLDLAGIAITRHVD